MRLDQHPCYDDAVDAMLTTESLTHDPRKSWGNNSKTWRLAEEHAETKTREELIRWFCVERSYRVHLESQMRAAELLIDAERERGRMDAAEPVRGNLAAYARLYGLIADARRSGRKTLRVEALLDAIHEGDTE